MLLFTPDDKSILFYENKQLVFRDVITGDVRHTINLQHYDVSMFHLQFSPDGTKLLLMPFRKQPRLLDAVTGEELQVYEHPLGWVEWGEFCHDGQQVLLGGPYHEVYRWDVKTRTIVQRYHHRGNIIHFTVSRDNRYLVGGYGENLSVWDLESGEILRTIPKDRAEHIDMVLMLPDDQQTLICELKHGLILRLSDGQIVRELDANDETVMIDAAIGREANLLITNGDRGMNAARIWDIQTWELKTTLTFPAPPPHYPNPSHVDITQNGRYAVTVEVKGSQLYVWDVNKAAILRQCQWNDYFIDGA